MDNTSTRSSLQVVAALVTGATAVSAYAGVVGLMGGGISFGPTVDARLPFGSLWLAGTALLLIVALPMTAATVADWRGTPHHADAVSGAGLLLVAWIGIELAFIKVYSWFHPTYLGVALVVLVLGSLLGRRSRPAPVGAGPRASQPVQR
jgi:hypothetical protein